MENRLHKPKMSAQQLVAKMKNEKGISFKLISEAEAEEYLENVNNYLRTAAYRKNYQKYSNGCNKGKYIDLDFQYLKELSTIDMRFRFLVSRMCCDIEHDLKIRLLNEIDTDQNEDGYDIVKSFLDENEYIRSKLEVVSSSPYTGDLIQKYFSLTSVYNNKNREENRIVAYDDCPVWVLVELLSFGDFIRFYTFFYENAQGVTKYNRINPSIINLVRELRNACAHNNCVLANLHAGDSRPPREIRNAIAGIQCISSDQREKRLSNRPMLEFVAMLYLYREIVSPKVKANGINELKSLFFVRMTKNKDYFAKNQLIKSNYDFACKIILSFFE